MANVTREIVAEFVAVENSVIALQNILGVDHDAAIKSLESAGKPTPASFLKAHKIDGKDLKTARDAFELADLQEKLSSLTGGDLVNACENVYSDLLNGARVAVARLSEALPERTAVRLNGDGEIEIAVSRGGSPRYQYYTPAEGTVTVAGKQLHVIVTPDTINIDGIVFEQGKLSGKGIDRSLSQAVHGLIGYNGTSQRISLQSEIFKPLGSRGIETLEQFQRAIKETA